MLVLFAEAQQISHHAVSRFLEEIFYAPAENNGTKQLAENLATVLNHVHKNFDYPLKSILFEAGIAILNHGYLPIKKILIFLAKASRFPGNYAALNIILHSAKRNRQLYRAVRLYDTILTRWTVPLPATL